MSRIKPVTAKEVSEQNLEKGSNNSVHCVETTHRTYFVVSHAEVFLDGFHVLENLMNCLSSSTIAPLQFDDDEVACCVTSKNVYVAPSGDAAGNVLLLVKIFEAGFEAVQLINKQVTDVGFGHDSD